MTDEENEAVDKIKTLIQYLNKWKENFTIVPDDVKYLVTVLNLIEKQSKEIEEYKECERLSKRQLEKQKNDIESLEIEIEELKEDLEKR